MWLALIILGFIIALLFYAAWEENQFLKRQAKAKQEMLERHQKNGRE